MSGTFVWFPDGAEMGEAAVAHEVIDDNEDVLVVQVIFDKPASRYAGQEVTKLTEALNDMAGSVIEVEEVEFSEDFPDLPTTDEEE